MTTVDLGGPSTITTDTSHGAVDLIVLAGPNQAQFDLGGFPVTTGTPVVSGPPGVPGPPGPPGPVGESTYPNQFQWADPTVQHELTPGFISGDTVPTTIGAAGRFSVNQIDQAGLNVGYYNLQPGDQVVIRDAETGSIFILTITLRERCSDVNHACFRYVVAAVQGINTNQPVLGDTVHAAPLPAQPSEISYHHYQPNADVVWTITHNLDFRPTVSVVDSTGREVWPGEVDYVDASTIRLTFSAAFGGEAYLS